MRKMLKSCKYEKEKTSQPPLPHFLMRKNMNELCSVPPPRIELETNL